MSEQIYLARDDKGFRLAVQAAGMGIWNWDILTGAIDWTAQTYGLFGFAPGAFASSYDSFVDRVHPDDREMFAAGLSLAVRDRLTNEMEFRIRRPDRSVRWLSCTGRVYADQAGRATHMLGLIADITERKGAGDEETAPPRPIDTSLSTRQVAVLLGVGEATVKRLADRNNIGCLRSVTRGARRFGHQHVIEVLRRDRPRSEKPAPAAFLAAALDNDADECVALALEAAAKGARIDRVLDELALPAAGKVKDEWLISLLARLVGMGGGHPPRRNSSAIVAALGGADLRAAALACVLRASGFEVMTPTSDVAIADLVEMAARVGARFVAFALTDKPTAEVVEAVQAAAAIASTLRSGSVCAWVSPRQSLPGPVARIASMEDLAALLR